MKVKRKDAIMVICSALDHLGDNGFETLLEDYYDEKNDDMPSMQDVLEAVKITEAEMNAGLK
jgi:hypothetical protein